MALGVAYQAKVKDSANVLVGIAQVRVGKPSVRAAGTAEIKAAQAVTQSDLLVDASDGVSKYVKPLSTANTGTAVITASGTYTGDYDGCFIIRVADATTVDIIAPNGYIDEGVLNSALTSYDMKLAAAVTSGVEVTATITTPTVKDTYIIPVWSGSAQSKVQTGITSPYSMFRGAAESVGGLKSASFAPKIDDKKELASGFPETVDDTMITKTSVGISFEAQEYTNANMAHLKNLISAAINDSSTSALPVEVVMRTRGNSLVTFWCPSCTIDSFPEFAPQQDYSSFNWSLVAGKMTEVTGETDAYNAVLRNTQVYYEHGYLH